MPCIDPPDTYIPYRSPFKQLILIQKAGEHLRTTGSMDAKASVYPQYFFRDNDDASEFLQRKGYEVIPLPSEPEYFTQEEVAAFHGPRTEGPGKYFADSMLRVQCKQYLIANTFLFCPMLPGILTDDAIQHQPPALFLGSPGSAGMLELGDGNYQLSATTIEFGRKAAAYAINPKAFCAGNLRKGDNVCNNFVLCVRDGRPSMREPSEDLVFENEGEGKLIRDQEGELIEKAGLIENGELIRDLSIDDDPETSFQNSK